MSAAVRSYWKPRTLTVTCKRHASPACFPAMRHCVTRRGCCTSKRNRPGQIDTSHCGVSKQSCTLHAHMTCLLCGICHSICRLRDNQRLGHSIGSPGCRDTSSPSFSEMLFAARTANGHRARPMASQSWQLPKCSCRSRGSASGSCSWVRGGRYTVCCQGSPSSLNRDSDVRHCNPQSKCIVSKLSLQQQ